MERKNAPRLLGELFVEYVQARRGKRFRELLEACPHYWGLYFRFLSPEEQLWAVAHRPMNVPREIDL